MTPVHQRSECPEFSPYTIYWEDEPSRERRVVARCVRCEKTVMHNGKFERGSLEAFEVVSRTGIAHMGAEYGVTNCGIDATGEDWWWPL